ncbi:HPr kinase/phosphorylase [Zavarzinia compransoris]|uniref:Serine/threonine protein kinase n=1 Tax=Zavarzinia compransoris TaxID=1264899 RepID=A0A317DWH0_9PROT|nr:HPr kinase/phosphatase C-terminal domain-containing protein [Zavarzinia compransoris]PWR18772.1 serine/threonine protein kinase [Zavarzinia compransoris]TDP48756.1 Hpr(Ser) kinase/phosphatase [Zavarzinia compransoris]
MSPPHPFLLHGTCVALGPHGVLLRGPSGAGKSDLALRLIDRGARLVADDQVRLRAEAGTLIATAPDNLRGLIEVRGLGIVALGQGCPSVPLRLVVDLAPPAAIARLPEAATATIADMILSRIALTPFEASAPLKVELALRAATGDLKVTR